jgi:hypothetical protein
MTKVASRPKGAGSCRLALAGVEPALAGLTLAAAFFFLRCFYASFRWFFFFLLFYASMMSDLSVDVVDAHDAV